jgi:hypothetical protein
VGPGDGEYAAALAGADGVVTILSGDVKGDGSDKADVYATTLRVWAPFMNPYERLVIQPDREFHNRVATAHATAAGQPGADDPTRVNLQTAQSYGPPQVGGAPSGPTLFTSQEQQQGQPQNVAGSIQQATSGIGQGGASTGAVRGRALRAVRARPGAGARAVQTWVRKATATPGAPYLAYADMPGAAYSPVNTPTVRPVAVVQPAGFSFSSDATHSVPPNLTSLAPADAAAAIDALQGVPWEQSPHAPTHVRAAAAQGLRVGNWWTDFWNWLTGVVAEITHIIVSIAEEVYVGIRLIVQGIAYVFQQIIHVIEEVASFIGSIFKELLKLIEDVIEALSVLFHFGEILWTHKFVRDELLNRVNGISGNPAYPGFAAVVKDTVSPNLTSVFEEAEGKVGGFFDQLADKIAGAGAAAGGPGLDQLKGQGATSHTAYTVQPRGGGQPSSHAPQCSWAMHKLKGGLGGAGGGGNGGEALGRAQAPAARDADPLAAFIDAFATSISGDGALSSQWQQVQQGAQNMGHSTSASDFLAQGVAELLRVLALIVEGAIAVAKAFLLALLELIVSLISLLLDTQHGLLTQPLDIPVLSWLYQLVFGEPLTLLNVVTLVAAIPVTILWRIVEGQWPRESLGAQTAARVGQLSPLAARVVGCFGGIVTICAGLVAAVGDAEGDQSPPPLVGRLGLVCGLLGAGLSIPLATKSAPGPLDWAAWGVALGAGTLNVFGSIELTPGGAAEKVLTYLVPVLLSATSMAQLGIFIQGAVDNPPPDWVADLALATNIAGAVAGIFNPAKLFTELLALLIAILDGVMGFVVGALQIALAFITTG